MAQSLQAGSSRESDRVSHIASGVNGAKPGTPRSARLSSTAYRRASGNGGLQYEYRLGGALRTVSPKAVHLGP
jgi:hypothetical protein